MQPDTTSHTQSNQPSKSAVFYVAGGYGKNLIATVPVRELARRGYRVQVIASHPRAWIGNPYVERIHPLQACGLYEVVQGADLFVQVDPYNDRSHILSLEHCAETWVRLTMQRAGLPPLPPASRSPVCRPTGAEVAAANLPDEPFALIQASGGKDDDTFSWVRDLPPGISDEVAQRLKSRGLQVYQVRTEKQRPVEGAIPLTFPSLRHAYPWIASASARVFIDSAAGHISAALGAPSVVCWPVASRAIVFGYEAHENILGPSTDECCRPPSPGLLHEYDITGRPAECPFADLKTIFDPDEIVERAVRSGNVIRTSDP